MAIKNNASKSIKAAEKALEEFYASDIMAAAYRAEAIYNRKVEAAKLGSPAHQPEGLKILTNHQIIIGALLELMLGGKQPAFRSQNLIIGLILEKFPGVQALSKRNLEDKFASSKQILNGSKIIGDIEE